MNRIPRDEVILDAVVDQVDQVAVLADQHRYEEISLRKKDNTVQFMYSTSHKMESLLSKEGQLTH